MYLILGIMDESSRCLKKVKQINNILRMVQYKNVIFCDMIDATFIYLCVKF